MFRQCIICKKKDYLNPEVAFRSLGKEDSSCSATSEAEKHVSIGSTTKESPEKRRRNLALVNNWDEKGKRKIHTLQMTVRTLKLKITSLTQLINYLKEKSYISESSEPTIKASLSRPALEIFERMLKGPTGQKYDPVLRSFAVTLAFYSPKAYTFVRNTFNRSLPQLGTISKWYRIINGSPGFTQEALNALSLKQNSSTTIIIIHKVN